MPLVSVNRGGGIKRYVALLTGILECGGIAGVIFGWPSLVYILKKEQYFADICPTESNGTTVGCDRQDERFSLIFTLASFANNFMSLPNGLLFDHCGTSVTRAVGISLHTSSTLMIAFSDAATAYILFPALCCTAIGGIIFLITNLQIGNLFGEHRSTVITLYNGAFDSSSITFLIVKVLYEAGLSLQSIFLFISSLSVILVLRTIFLLPRKSIPYPVPEGYTFGAHCGPLTPDTSDQDRCQGDPPDTQTVKSPKGPQEQADGVSDVLIPLTVGSPGQDATESVPTFRSCVLSSLFLTHCVWLSLMQLRHYLFIGTLNPMLIQLADNDPQLVSRFTNAFAFIQFCGILFAPWNGLILDRRRRRSKRLDRDPAPPSAQRRDDMDASILSLALTVGQCICFSICASVPVLELQYLTFILQVVNRSFLYGGHASFIATAFPPTHFGKVYGLSMAISALVSLLQYACFALITGLLNDDPLYMNIGFILLSSVAFCHPVNVYLHVRRLPESNLSQHPSPVTVPGSGDGTAFTKRETDI
ncbi:equilibrative nucleobase transporter 1-like isoform X2 [Narcine bancroftii]|uniref:equilibrative nucleobase transporter 1-like isoform X2 n=1 Tax=Narcine bancroftii TaxID=1343680 RepID=UPI0038315B69